MTAEVAILNRSAVALATDSAVTLRSGEAEKIYDTADKLFELSAKNPIAIMVYNNLEFLSIPLEVIIKKFRDSPYCTNFSTVFDAASSFLQYINNPVETTAPKEVIDDCVYGILYDEFVRLRSIFEENVRFHYTNNRKQKPDMHSIFIMTISERSDELEKLTASACFDGMTHAEVIAHHIDAFERSVAFVFKNYPITAEDKMLLVNLAGLALHRDTYSSSRTGLIFAGFGSDELFPSLKSFETDGIIAGRLKIKETNKVDIDRLDRRVEIVPFAQREMADRFLFGIDPEFESVIAETYDQILLGVEQKILSLFKRSPKKRREHIQDAVQKIIDAAATHHRNDTMPQLKEVFKKQIEDMVLLMPKQELAFMAESLINITSIKRKVSAQQESVGGPIDVAIITRAEGFIWVKRKHYFDPKFNPRFFQRRYGTIPSGVEEVANGKQAANAAKANA